jgi:putative MFS transporter
MAELTNNGSDSDPINAMSNTTYKGIHRIINITAAAGAFTDAYSITLISGATFSVVPFLLKTTSNLSLAGTMLLIGAILGALTMGRVVDVIGRRLTFILTLLAIFVLSIISIFVTSITELYLVRFLIGFSLGADYPAAMSMVAELNPTAKRGQAMIYLWVSYTIGAMLGLILGYVLYRTIGPVSYEWRIMLGSAAVPALIGLLFRLRLPESPRWAIKMGKLDLASSEIYKLTGIKYSDSVLEATRKSFFTDQKVKIRKHYGAYSYRIVFVFLALMFMNLVPGALVVLNPTILAALGISKAAALLFSSLFLGVQLIAVLIVAFSVERVGRIVYGIVGGVLEGLFAILVIFLYHNALILLVLFSGVYFFSFLAIPVMRNAGAEIFPTEFRGLSSGIVMSGDRLAGVIGLLLTPILFAGKNVTLLFSVYGVCGILGAIFVFLTLYRLKVDKKSIENIQEEILNS